MVSKRRQIEFCQACSAMINNFSNFHAILHRAAEETQDDTSRRRAAQNRCKFKIRTERGPNGKWIFYFFFPYLSPQLCTVLGVKSPVSRVIHTSPKAARVHPPQIQQLIVFCLISCCPRDISSQLTEAGFFFFLNYTFKRKKH